MTTSDKKPNLTKQQMWNDKEIVIITKEIAEKQDSIKLRKVLDYYDVVLESLVGTQIWDILEAMTAVSETLVERRQKSEQEKQGVIK